MPAALNVNREAVRVLVVAVGVREAARQMNIPAGTVLAWANRGQWLQSKRDAIERKTAAIEQSRNQSPTYDAKTGAIVSQSTAITPADSLANTLADENNRTKLGFSRAAVKVAETAGAWKPGKILNKSRELRDVATIAGKVHGWDESKGDDKRVMINIGILNE